MAFQLLIAFYVLCRIVMLILRIAPLDPNLVCYQTLFNNHVNMITLQKGLIELCYHNTERKYSCCSQQTLDRDRHIHIDKNLIVHSQGFC